MERDMCGQKPRGGYRVHVRDSCTVSIQLDFKERNTLVGVECGQVAGRGGEELRLTVAKSRALSHVVPDLGKVARMMSVGLASNSFRTIMAATMGGIGRKKPSWKQRSG
ncbi:cytosolic sulfotransferase 15-like [Iris pallida]|uniref:Cytosolic sulfotransferase 15-like n=1 Tax=Iris pallida TaxID=29817 RepID=A0AAX6H230_IRIPA|nr:cytosolic sulfotransferase 15-like [Iris pallida]